MPHTLQELLEKNFTKKSRPFKRPERRYPFFCEGFLGSKSEFFLVYT